MKTNLLLFAIGLMCLMAISCEDHFSYDDEKNFLPMKYEAKGGDTEEVPSEEYVSSTLSILGIKGLVFDEQEKSDWKIITPSSFTFDSDEPLTILGKLFPVENEGNTLMYIPNNIEDFPLAFGNTKVIYSYMGQDIILSPNGGLNIVVTLEEIARRDEPFFFQRGYVVFKLLVGYIPVKIHKVPFLVFDKEKSEKDWNADDFDDVNDEQQQEDSTDS